MRFNELLKFSFMNLWRRRLRSSLTILGVMIGTASIVVMVSLGIGLNYSYLQQIESSSTLTLITVNSYGGDMYYSGGMASSDSSSSSKVVLDENAVSTFAGLEHVKAASPVYSFNIIVQAGEYQADMYVNAMSLDMLRALNIPIIKGELPQQGDAIKLIAGKQSVYNFYKVSSNGNYEYFNAYDDNGNPVDPPVDLNTTPVFAIYDTNAYYNWQSGQGEAPKKQLLYTTAIVGSADENGWSDYDYSCYADLDAVNALFQRTFRKNVWPNQQTDSKGKPIWPMRYNTAYVVVDDIEAVTDVQKQITDMGYQASSQLDYLNAMKQQSRTIQYVLAGIGGVSLLVAAIGIANTMLMSIFERTKEIGIFKVLGCSLPNIRNMFLTEAGMIGLTGGILGLLLSYGLSTAINMLIGQGSVVSMIPVWLAAFGAGFAVLVGVVSGLSPALRAMKLSPLEAIRSL